MPKTKTNQQTRRNFLTQTTAGILAAPYVLPSSVLGANGQTAPSERVAMGVIGTGGRGTGVMKHFLGFPDAQVVAVCDAYQDRVEAARDLVNDNYDSKDCKTYRDFRDLLARDDIDAVLIATQDSWHCFQGIMAADAKKDMYIEKPLSRTVEEGRALCKAVKRNQRIFQHGTQQRSDALFLHACELVRNGCIGELKTAIVGSPAGEEYKDTPEMPVPPGFDYNMWLGPAPHKPYTEMRCITPYWYFISDYTIGYVAGWGVHHIDIAQWGNGSDATGPVEIEGQGTFPKSGMCDTPTAWHAEMTYANGVKVIFTDNVESRQGVRFEGTEGWVHVQRGAIDAEPKSLLQKTFGSNDERLYMSPHHQKNFIDCVKSRKETICPAETAHRTTTICHLTYIALLLGRKLKWDPEKELFVGDDEANGMLSRKIRGEWKL